MKKLRFAILTVSVVTAAGICINGFADSGDKIQQQTELEAVAPKVTSYSIPDALPLEWEHKHPERKLWSEYAESVVNTYFDELNMADDFTNYCPDYDKLTYNEKVQAWAQLFVGISKWESSWDPTEPTLEGNDPDPETGRKLYSQGLLQLSYQDIESNPYCTFSWQADKDLSQTDPHATINNPFSNLYCGIRIMADAIRDNVDDKNCTGGHHRVACNEYWSTLDANDHLHSKNHSIEAEMRNTLPFCGSHMRGEIMKEDWTKFANIHANRDVIKVWRSTVGEAEDYVKKHEKKKAEATPDATDSASPSPSDSASPSPSDSSSAPAEQQAAPAAPEQPQPQAQ